LEGSPAARLVVGAALLAVGVWRGTAIAVVVGAGLLVAAAVGAVNARNAGHGTGQHHDRGRWPR
jgi:hypothetical protein